MVREGRADRLTALLVVVAPPCTRAASEVGGAVASVLQGANRTEVAASQPTAQSRYEDSEAYRALLPGVAIVFTLVFVVMLSLSGHASWCGYKPGAEKKRKRGMSWEDFDPELPRSPRRTPKASADEELLVSDREEEDCSPKSNASVRNVYQAATEYIPERYQERASSQGSGKAELLPPQQWRSAVPVHSGNYQHAPLNSHVPQPHVSARRLGPVLVQAPLPSQPPPAPAPAVFYSPLRRL
eukprot:TRINITY_DN7537_c0_g1_i2.p1 TRINITY_DN7537_c0_g1~~TRINITY_DN7537_c0_g1_i2.p1  ORF type:complete len:241 (-),score=25.21 TRINITY_DN7537_c0_g1_i2:126-848(-)